jgi:arginyl-tRNA synthetase
VIEDRLRELFRAALVAAGLLDDPSDVPEITFEKPRQKGHGDLATPIALAFAQRAGRPPREVAEAIRAALPPSPLIREVEIGGPGFLNLRLANDWLYDALRDVIDRGASYGRGEPNGRRIDVEFVSANPTGPLTLGHARNAAIGDALSRLFAFAGWTVEREYYFNDAGGQMDRFGRSVEARYLQLVGRPAEVPEDGYHGEYVAALAKEILDVEGPSLAELPDDERFVRLREEGATRVLRWIRDTLERFGVRYDVWTSEADLAARGEIEQAIDRMRAAGHVYEADGAVWFRSTTFGDDKDRVLIRSNGIHTYFAADCAYLVDKFSRGFDRLVYVLGADHHGDVARLQGGAEALGYDRAAVEIVLYQWVSFLRGGEPVPMSKRAGTFIALDELIDEVGADAARFHLLTFSNDATMSFDIETVRRQSMDNPVYYVQYGHARISSILRTANEAGVTLQPLEDVDLSPLTHETETDLVRALADVPEMLARAAELRAPHRVAHAATDIAKRFHAFYTERRVIGEDDRETQARLWLSRVTQQVLANLLAILGVAAPERMERVDA